jgi:NDP-sugar pyrophosphorylase family protein
MISRAVVLAAGRGTRLGALTADRPKPVLEVAGRPLLLRILDGLVLAGVSEVVVITGYLGEMVRTTVDAAGLPLHVDYRHQAVPDGTARGVALARDQLADDPFVFAWGDILVDAGNYPAVVAAAEGCDGSLAVNVVDDPWAGAAVDVDEAGYVTGLVEKPPRGTSRTNYNNAGFGVLPAQIWSDIDALTVSERGEFELPRAIAALVARGGRLRAVPVIGTWWDIGTPDDLDDARRTWDPRSGR